MSIGGVEIRLSRFRRGHDLEVGENSQGRACCGWEVVLGLLRKNLQQKR